jgi:hypothetical protein
LFFVEFVTSGFAFLAETFSSEAEVLVLVAPVIAACGGVAAFFMNRERAKKLTLPKVTLMKLLDGFIVICKVFICIRVIFLFL